MLRSGQSNGQAWWTSRLLLAGASILFVSAFAAMAEQLVTIFRFIPRDYNEGWNAYWAAAAWDGTALYPPPDSTVANNYPPFSFYLVGALGRLIGDNVFAGRLLALGSLFGVAAGIYFWLRAVGLSRCALVAAALFLAALALYAPHYVAMDDPQMLGHVLMVVAGLILWRGDFSARALAWGAALLLLGGLTKQLLFPLPLAITLWIAFCKRGRLLQWLEWCLAFGAIALLSLIMLHASLLHSIDAARSYSTLLAQLAFTHLAESLPLVLLIGSVGCIFACVAPAGDERRRRFAIFVLLYLILAALGGTLAASGVGVDKNAFFDLLIATSLAVGSGIDALLLRRRAGVAALLAILLACLTLPVALHAAASLRISRHRIAAAAATEAAYVAEIGSLKSAGMGAAACEMPALCYWAGQPFTLDFFNYGQELRSQRPVDACERVFGNGSLTTLQLDAPRAAILSKRLPDSCNQTIARYFAPAQTTHSGVLFKRRS